MRAHPGEVLVARAGVDDQAEPGLVEEIDDQVVDHAAAPRSACSCTAPCPGLSAWRRRWRAGAQELAHPRAARVDDAHVRDVEHAGVAAHRVVLLDLRAVVDRHVPAAEIDHAGAQLDVQVIERCASAQELLPVRPRGTNKKGGGKMGTSSFRVQTATTCWQSSPFATTNEECPHFRRPSVLEPERSGSRHQIACRTPSVDGPCLRRNGHRSPEPAFRPCRSFA